MWHSLVDWGCGRAGVHDGDERHVRNWLRDVPLRPRVFRYAVEEDCMGNCQKKKKKCCKEDTYEYEDPYMASVGSNEEVIGDF